VQMPEDAWTQWTNCPSLHPARLMSNPARYNAGDGRVQVKFASGGGPGGPNTYEYPGGGKLRGPLLSPASW
jgi:hypothetical protein